MSKLWFEDYPESSNKINSEQKILEVLAIDSPLTVNELIDKTKLDIDVINKILYKHTTQFFKSTILPSIGIISYSTTTPKSLDKLYPLFLRHNLIKVINDNSNTKYELSLFGVILVIKLLQYYNIHNKENHYYNQFTFLDYFGKIVRNYREKIPLVFGKWYILKKILKNYAIYNLDVIIDPDDSLNERQISISLGGNKELYYGIKEISTTNP